MRKIYRKLYDLSMLSLGALLQSLSILYFIKPLNIPLGGVPGISLILNYLFNFPIGVMTILFNIPLFFVGYRYIGKLFLLKTSIAIVVSSIMVDLLSSIIPAFSGDILLAAIFGGLLNGVGVALIFIGGGTSGGTDIISKILLKKYNISIGKSSLYISVVIIGMSAFTYDNFQLIFYAIILQFTTSIIIDHIVVGQEICMNCLIVSQKIVKLEESLNKGVNRTYTMIKCIGGFSKEEKTAIICVVRKNELSELKRIVLENDPEAFMVITHSYEVIGKQFWKEKNENES